MRTPSGPLTDRLAAASGPARVLRLAVAERPVLLAHLDEVDEHVFAPQLQALVQAVGQRLVEGALRVQRPAFVERDLDDDAVGERAMPRYVGSITKSPGACLIIPLIFLTLH
jgi:hypothetical protein